MAQQCVWKATKHQLFVIICPIWDLSSQWLQMAINSSNNAQDKSGMEIFSNCGKYMLTHIYIQFARQDTCISNFVNPVIIINKIDVSMLDFTGM